MHRSREHRLSQTESSAESGSYHAAAHALAERRLRIRHHAKRCCGLDVSATGTTPVVVQPCAQCWRDYLRS